MVNWKKTMMASAGGGGGLNVEDVFSTYLYEGNDSTQTITNGIDLSTEGGLVWIKPRDYAYPHYLYDSERSLTYHLVSHSTNGNSTDVNDSMDSFNSDGFTISGGANLNASWPDYCSWTFRKAPKFFDVVTYTGNGTAGKTVSHNLGSVPGMIIVKRTNGTGEWYVYHRGIASDAETDYMTLESDNQAYDSSIVWNDTAPTSTEFTLGNYAYVNGNGDSFVAYLFAHNDGDGDFGPTGDQDIIKCGSYTGNGSSDGPTINLGFEPQWVLIKKTDAAADWVLMDNMRGIVNGSNDQFLRPNSTSTEVFDEYITLEPTGFKLAGTSSRVNTSGSNYTYVAIRRGPMAVPEDASDVFNVQHQNDSSTGYYGYIGKPVDLWMSRNVTSQTDMIFRDRLRGGNYLRNTSNSTETSQTLDWYGNNVGAYATTNTNTSQVSWTWRRAPSFFDILAYKGSSSSLTLDHSLGVSPEMVWIHARDSSSSNDWFCWHKDLSSIGDSTYPNLSLTSHLGGYFNSNLSPTVSASSITIPSNVYVSNASYSYISYLFATAAGVSKVGSYTGDGTTGRVIDCGFSAGAKFIIMKRVAANGDWYIWDTERGIVSGNDTFILMNSQAANNPNLDTVDPHNSGFIINQNGTDLNVNGGKYIFYAVA